MKYKEDAADHNNFSRFKELTKNLLSVSNKAIKEKLADEHVERRKRRIKGTDGIGKVAVMKQQLGRPTKATRS